ncbi:MAG: triose-phosphate isomerase [Parcubacteria group bacterium]|jgi:triosephosphate isomerase
MKYVIGNLKMNLISQAELERYFKAFKNEIKGKNFKNTGIVVCPPSVFLKEFMREIKSKKVAIGVQNIFCERCGSYTGEISSIMVKNIGAEYAIVGHSERRKYFGENNKMINLKIRSLVKERMTAIFCFGETLEERGAGRTSRIISSQVLEGLEGVNPSGLERIIFAYEPVWAVGTDSTPTSNGIMEVKIMIRKILAEKYGIKHSEKAKILYGGSVKEKILKQVCIDPGMDGVLVGRESLNPHEFLKIAEILNNF